jgi:hypothetical protein
VPLAFWTWRLEVLKPQVDDGGYDLVLEANDVVRHVQLKTTFRGAKVRRWNVNALLSTKPSGCVVCVRFERTTLQFTDFYFFGGPPGKKLPSLGKTVAKHTKANAKGVKTDRPGIRVIRLASFRRVATMQELVQRLFGATAIRRRRRAVVT